MYAPPRVYMGCSRQRTNCKSDCSLGDNVFLGGNLSCDDDSVMLPVVTWSTDNAEGFDVGSGLFIHTLILPYVITNNPDATEERSSGIYTAAPLGALLPIGDSTKADGEPLTKLCELGVTRCVDELGGLVLPFSGYGITDATESGLYLLAVGSRCECNGDTGAIVWRRRVPLYFVPAVWVTASNKMVVNFSGRIRVHVGTTTYEIDVRAWDNISDKLGVEYGDVKCLGIVGVDGNVETYFVKPLQLPFGECGEGSNELAIMAHYAGAILSRPTILLERGASPSCFEDTRFACADECNTRCSYKVIPGWERIR